MIFSNNVFDKVINELKDIGINFVIVSKVEELLKFKISNNLYLEYCEKSLKNYNKFVKEKELIKKLKVILSIRDESYQEIDDFFNTFLRS